MDIKNINELLGKDFLEKFRIFHPVTLFPPVWENLIQLRCPLCGCKLRFPRTGKIAYCRAQAHIKSFTISVTKLYEMKEDLIWDKEQQKILEHLLKDKEAYTKFMEDFSPSKLNTLK